MTVTLIQTLPVLRSGNSKGSDRPETKFTNEAATENEEYEEEESEEKESGAEKQLMMWFQSKGYPNPSNLNDKYARGWEQFLEIREKTGEVQTRGPLLTGPHWVMYPA